MTTLYQLTEQYKQAFKALEDSDIDEKTIADTLEGLKGEVEEKGRNVAAYFQNLEADIEAMKEAERRISARRKNVEKQVAFFKDYLRDNMLKAGITEISCPEFCVKLGKPTVIAEIENESILPDEYVKVEVKKSPIKADILKALRFGADIPGARLAEGKARLTVK